MFHYTLPSDSVLLHFTGQHTSWLEFSQSTSFSNMTWYLRLGRVRVFGGAVAGSGGPVGATCTTHLADYSASDAAV